ncbi:MAG: cellulase family glycosylhydrolase, partial [Anaerolineales bacterium]
MDALLRFVITALILAAQACSVPFGEDDEAAYDAAPLATSAVFGENETPQAAAVAEAAPVTFTDEWSPPRTAAEWSSTPVRGAVIEIGYGGPDEYNDPPYPSSEDLQQLRALGARVVALEFQFAWTIKPPYQPDETQIALLEAALDNVAAAGLYAVVAVRNGPGRNAMMPDVDDADVITTLYTDEATQDAYGEMLQDVVERFNDRPEIIAWEPLVEPALDWFLTQEEDAPYSQAAALWNDLAPDLIAVIRAVDPERPILIEPVNWGGPGGFALLDRFDDDNLVYSLHTYEPFAFTHQQEPPYTAYPGVFDGEAFDRAALDALLTPVDDFQARHDAPIVVGEWGGIRWLPGIEQYISDQLSLFEQRGWSWLWYAWDDEEWDELGFELQMGPARDDPAYDPSIPAFAPIVAAWQAVLPVNAPQIAAPPVPFAYETRADGAVRLTDPPAGASDQNPAFSPDGRYLIFTRFLNGYNIGPAEVHRLDLQTGDVLRLTPVEDQDNVNLPGSSWNPANNRIVFASDRGESDDLWRVAPDGRDFSPITSHAGPPWYIEPSWSPDGAWIVFEADNDVPDDRQQGSIWKVRADGTDLTTLTDGPAQGVDDRQPNWSPAG